ncbi:unnamed protein product [Cuscuta europaea]|uniref:DUF1985 domain-containing protein n=1 Tax=Cuscuta europaea TaxID=41803 RepID=A0A9P0Z008_CUSEU|nr:unnamed protein product [Cuscuta europaea]
MPRLSGQLCIALLGSYIEQFNNNSEKRVIRFHIGSGVISFTRSDMALLLGLKLGGVRTISDDQLAGDFCRRYFGNKQVVSRQDMISALEAYNHTDPHIAKEDGVKLALLYVLAHGLLGHQMSRPLPEKYLKLVHDIEAFNTYPWGDDVWDDLVTNITRSAEALNVCDGNRVAFPGCMHVLQIWAFETFPSLANTGLCIIIQGRETVIPRTLKWAFHKKPSMEVFCDLIFDNGEVIETYLLLNLHVLIR